MTITIKSICLLTFGAALTGLGAGIKTGDIIDRATKFNQDKEYVMKSGINADEFQKTVERVYKDEGPLSFIFSDKTGRRMANIADSIRNKHLNDSIKTVVIDELKRAGKLLP